jgi:enolase
MGYNEDVFLKFKKLFYPMLKEIMSASKEIEKAVFEKELVTNSLDCAYVEVYSRKNKYYVFEDEKDCTYFIIKGNTLQLLFEKKNVI